MIRTRNVRMLALGALAGALAASCSGSSAPTADGATAQPVVSPGTAAPGARPVTVGPVTVSLPSALQRQPGAPSVPGSTAAQQVLFVGEPGPDGRRAAVSIGFETSDRSPKAAAQKLADYKRDIDRVEVVQQAPVSWPGFTEVYGVSYDDPKAAGTTEQLHAVAFIGRTQAGQMVNVTAKAPRSLFDSLALQQAVQSTRLAAR